MQFFSNALGIGRATVLCNNAELVNPCKARPGNRPFLVDSSGWGYKNTSMPLIWKGTWGGSW